MLDCAVLCILLIIEHTADVSPENCCYLVCPTPQYYPQHHHSQYSSHKTVQLLNKQLYIRPRLNHQMSILDDGPFY